MQHSIAPAIKELERSYKHFNKHLFNNELTDNVLITIQTRGTRKGVLAWYASNRWENGKETINEINLVAEVLKKNDPLASLIHEMVHHYNAVKGIKDCSRNGKYHNKVFKESAELCGLTCDKVDKIGWAHTNLDSKAIDAIKTLKIKHEAFKILRLEPVKKSSANPLIKWSCGCTNIWAKKKVFAGCVACGNNFVNSKNLC